MITIRYKPREKHKDFSVFLDIYLPKKYREINNGKARMYEFLNIYVSKAYTASDKILKIDKEKIEISKEIAARREIEILKGEYRPYNKQKTDNLLLFFERNENLENPRFKAVLLHLKNFCTTEKIHTPTFQIFNTDLVLKFQNYLLNKQDPPIGQTSVHNYMITLKTTFNRAIKQGLIKENPITFGIPKAVESKRTTLDISELQNLVNCDFETRISNYHVIRNAFLFSCFTGLRHSDILLLKWNDIENNTIRIIQYKTRTKKPEYNFIPLSEQAQSILAQIEKTENDTIFWNMPNNTTTSRYLKNWGLAAGLKKHLHFHAARHTFATIGLTHGIDLYTMKELLGHSQITMTQIYAKIVNQKKKAEILKFPKLNNG